MEFITKFIPTDTINTWVYHNKYPLQIQSIHYFIDADLMKFTCHFIDENNAPVRKTGSFSIIPKTDKKTVERIAKYVLAQKQKKYRHLFEFDCSLKSEDLYD